MGNGGGNGINRLDGCQRDKTNAIGKKVAVFLGNLGCQPRFAHAARPHKGQQPIAALLQPLPNLLAFGFTARKGGEVVGQAGYGRRNGRFLPLNLSTFHRKLGRCPRPQLFHQGQHIGRWDYRQFLMQKLLVLLKMGKRDAGLPLLRPKL